MEKKNKLSGLENVLGTFLGKVLAILLFLTFILGDIALIKWLFSYIL